MIFLKDVSSVFPPSLMKVSYILFGSQELS